jgi:hypothetical protein
MSILNGPEENMCTSKQIDRIDMQLIPPSQRACESHEEKNEDEMKAQKGILNERGKIKKSSGRVYFIAYRLDD